MIDLEKKVEIETARKDVKQAMKMWTAALESAQKAREEVVQCGGSLMKTA